MVSSPILEFHEVKKYFGGVKAVDGMSFPVNPAEIHAIVGENGAGKSTLMNILAGVIPCDGGRILLHGQPYAPANPRAARAKGISTVFQELALFATLPVDANIYIDKEVFRGPGLDHRSMREGAEATLRRMGVALDPAEMVGDLSMGQRQWVEIARALNDNAQIIILDEPNSALDQKETEALFGLLRRLREGGITILYISHRLEEVIRIADRITVVRDGHYVGTWEASQTTVSGIVAAMIGRNVSKLFERNPSKRETVVLEVANLTFSKKLAPISFSVSSGEVVGLAALAGSGLTELLEVVFGLRPALGGQILVGGHSLASINPSRAIETHIALVPADRRSLGLMPNWSVLDNITIAVLPRLSRYGVINHNRGRDLARRYVESLRIATERLDKSILLLSGGNQQKVLLARWLATEPHLFLLDDPTRGIDVGAKQEIYALIDRVSGEGVGVLFTSSEIDEIVALSDRVLVLREGQLVADIPRDVCDKELVMEFVAGDVDRGRVLLQQRTNHQVPSTSCPH
jgi:ABC-type sugar transport system ATPase subunit